MIKLIQPPWLCNNNVKPVKVVVLIIICIVQLAVDCTSPLPAMLRQQLVDAKAGPMMLACSSTAPQLNLVGWV